MPVASNRAIILFAHGARDPLWAAPFQSLQKMLAARPHAGRVELAFLELMKPDLDSVADLVVAEGCREIHLIPLFMAQGGHLRHDLPLTLQAIQQRHPDIVIHIAPAIGDVPEVLVAIEAWMARITSAG